MPAGAIRHLDHDSPHGHERHECGSSAGLDWTKTKEHAMGMYHSTYFAYGVHVPLIDDCLPWEEAQHCEATLALHKDELSYVRFLTAGDYDNDQLFLTTRCQTVEYGEWTHVTPESHEPALLTVWNEQLAAAVQALGYGDRAVSAPGWLCIPDLS